jgi:predicted DNA-binding antitoxin AbrB/MazE fold protein
MSIRAIYENGVFKPLGDVTVKEGTEGEVYPIGEQEGRGGKRRKSFMETEAYGIWADRTDIGNTVDYVNKVRARRRLE